MAANLMLNAKYPSSTWQQTALSLEVAWKSMASMLHHDCEDHWPSARLRAAPEGFLPTCDARRPGSMPGTSDPSEFGARLRSHFIQSPGPEMNRERVTRVAHRGAVTCCVEARCLLGLRAMFVQG